MALLDRFGSAVSGRGRLCLPAIRYRGSTNASGRHRLHDKTWPEPELWPTRFKLSLGLSVIVRFPHGSGMGSFPTGQRCSLTFCRPFGAAKQSIGLSTGSGRATSYGIEDPTIGSSLRIGGTEVPYTGFRVEDRLKNDGGLSEAERICGACEANIARERSEIAGCYG